MTEVRNYIRGEWVSIRQGREIEVRNPADQDELLGKGFLASAHEAEAAITAASEALPAWSHMPAPKRGEIVERAGDLLRAEQDDVARLLTREEGKTFGEAKGEIYRAYNVINYTAGQSRRMGGLTIPSELPKNFAYTIRQVRWIRWHGRKARSPKPPTWGTTTSSSTRRGGCTSTTS